MTVKHVTLAVLAVAWAWQPALAQEPAQAQDAPRDSANILEAIRLPALAEALRERGVPVEEIEAAITGASERDVAPGEMSGVFEETAETVDETGPIENFGAYVQEQLRAGLRGRDLAEAIRAEHQRRGIGQGNKLESRGHGPPGERGPAAAERGRGNQPGAAAGQRGQGGSQPDEVADTSARGGPPADRGQGRQQRDTVPDTSGQGPGGGNGGGR